IDRAGTHRLDIPKWLTARGVAFKQKPNDSQGRTVYVLDACPFHPEHGDHSCVMQSPDGKLAARCLHNSCSGRGWKDFQEKSGPPDPEHWDPPLGSLRYPSRAMGGEDNKDGEDVPSQTAEDNRPQIIISADEHKINAKAITALARQKGIFQRAGQLVR